MAGRTLGWTKRGRRLGGGVALTVASLALATPALAQRDWQNPGHANAAQARDLVKQGNCAAALDYFDLAVDQLQTDATLVRDRGWCHDKLGNPMPAIADYRRYLSMAPNAPDAVRVQARLDELEAQHQGPTREYDHDRDGRNEELPKTTADLEDPFAIDEEKKEEKPEVRPRVPARGWLLGPYFGWRDSKVNLIGGGPDIDTPHTISIGAIVGYAYRRGAEAQARVAFLRTGSNGDTTGVGVGVDHFWKVGITATRQWELMFGLGVAYERQQTEDLRLDFNFYVARFQPMVRWAIVPAIALQAGPEIGIGALKGEAVGGVSPDAQDYLYYGVAVGLLWRIGAGSGGSDQHEGVDPDQPLDEEDLWDD